jgi:hypothetical protein
LLGLLLISSSIGLVDDQKAGLGFANPAGNRNQKPAALTNKKHEIQTQ